MDTQSSPSCVLLGSQRLGKNQQLLGTHPFSAPIYVTWEQDPAAFYNPHLEPPPLLPSWPRKSPGLESVLPLDLGLELPGCGVFRPQNQLQTKERQTRSRWEGGRRGKEKRVPFPSPKESEVGWRVWSYQV